jgi:preprotein translocase subunit Sec61beta
VEQSRVGVLRASEATLADSSVFALVGDRVQAANVSTLWLIAQHVEGEVKAVIDPRSAVLLGAAFGGVFGLFSLVSGVLRRRQN